MISILISFELTVIHTLEIEKGRIRCEAGVDGVFLGIERWCCCDVDAVLKDFTTSMCSNCNNIIHQGKHIIYTNCIPNSIPFDFKVCIFYSSFLFFVFYFFFVRFIISFNLRLQQL